MIRWPILAIFWNGYPPSPTTGFMNCCRTTGGPQNNNTPQKEQGPQKRAGSRRVHRMFTYENKNGGNDLRKGLLVLLAMEYSPYVDGQLSWELEGVKMGGF